MRLLSLALLAVILLGAALAGCTAETPPASEALLSPGQRDDAFWTAYEQRLGMVGRDYADPVAAKRESIEFGHTICNELAEGLDYNVAVSQITGPTATEAEAKVKVDTAIEFLCPEQG